MCLFLLSGNGFDRAFSLAEPAAGTGFRINIIMEQGFADASRAFFIPNMSIILFTKIPDRGQYGVCSRSSEAAKRKIVRETADFIQQLNVAFTALAMGNAVEYFPHPDQSFPAGRTLTTGLLEQEVDEIPGHLYHAGVFIHDDHSAGTHDGSD